MSGKANRILPIAIIGFLVIAFTLLIFFLVVVERTTINLLALTFLLISEVCLFSGLIAVRVLGTNYDKLSMTIGVTSTLLLYFFITLVMVFTTGLFGGNIAGFILMEMGIIIVTAIFLIIFFSAASKISSDNKGIIAAKNFMDGCEKRIYGLMQSNYNNLYTGSFKSIYEGIKYSDKISSSSVDLKMNDAITRLETSFEDEKQDKKEISGIFDEITELLNRRKAEVSESKRGGF